MVMLAFSQSLASGFFQPLNRLVHGDIQLHITFALQSYSMLGSLVKSQNPEYNGVS